MSNYTALGLTRKFGGTAIRRATAQRDLDLLGEPAPQRHVALGDLLGPLQRRHLAAALALAVTVAALLAFAPVADWVKTPLPDLPGAPHVAQAPPAEAYPVPPTLELNLVPVPAPRPSPVFRAF